MRAASMFLKKKAFVQLQLGCESPFSFYFIEDCMARDKFEIKDAELPLVKSLR